MLYSKYGRQWCRPLHSFSFFLWLYDELCTPAGHTHTQSWISNLMGCCCFSFSLLKAAAAAAVTPIKIEGPCVCVCVWWLYNKPRHQHSSTQPTYSQPFPISFVQQLPKKKRFIKKRAELVFVYIRIYIFFFFKKREEYNSTRWEKKRKLVYA